MPCSQTLMVRRSKEWMYDESSRPAVTDLRVTVEALEGPARVHRYRVHSMSEVFPPKQLLSKALEVT